MINRIKNLRKNQVFMHGGFLWRIVIPYITPDEALIAENIGWSHQDGGVDYLYGVERLTRNFQPETMVNTVE